MGGDVTVKGCQNEPTDTHQGAGGWGLGGGGMGGWGDGGMGIYDPVAVWDRIYKS